MFIGYTQFHTLDLYNKRAFHRIWMQQGLFTESGNKESRRSFLRTPYLAILQNFYIIGNEDDDDDIFEWHQSERKLHAYIHIYVSSTFICIIAIS